MGWSRSEFGAYRGPYGGSQTEGDYQSAEAWEQMWDAWEE